MSASLAGISGVSTTVSYGSAGAMSLGGYATKTGSGGSITINSGSVIDTVGVMSDGIKAQSIGGGGGNTALFDGYSGSPFATGAMFLGGGSSGGGSGGDVTVYNNNNITTTNALSLGILAQSLGGGGGDARLASLANTGLTSGLTVGLGAQSGAKGGNSGDVSVTNSDTIYTQGHGSDAMVAQAIGGGGGMGSLSGSGSVAPVFTNNGADTKGSSQSGSSTSIAVDTSSSSSAAGIESGASTAGAAVTTHRGSTLAAVLGASGSSSDGQTVAVTNNGSLQTTNDGSNAAIAQSIGAGGGIVRHHLSNFDQMQTSLSLLLGAVESASGQSGAVSISSGTVISTSKATTQGNASMGLLAQSIGGGGGLGLFTGRTVGPGGSASLSLALGGQGSSVGAGDSVSVTTGGTITTVGDQSQGIVAQSISNGGGVTKVVLEAAASGARLAQTSSYTLAGSLLAQANTNNGLAVAAVLGGGSTTAKEASDVTVTSASTISTSGIRSAGIVAQSVAGGGGIVDITTTALNGGDFAADILLGGSSKSTGSTVSVTTTGTISTFGHLADGILAQSINSGGGSFGVSHLSALESGAGTLDFQLGSNGINDKITGEAVTVTVGASIATAGNGSTAITAQSLGAGGGVLAFKLSSATDSLTVYGRLGSEASSQGKAGAVTVTANASLSSTGEFATLVLAQSIGGGGGRVVGQTMGSYPVGQLVLGAGNNGGDGNTVSVITNKTLTTTNNYSHGIVAQSIGAGGGLSDLLLGMGSSDSLNASGLDITVAFGAASSAQGVGGEVTVQVDGGPISTAGINALGVVAQSIGGGGGLAVMSKTGEVSFGGQASSGPNGGAVSVSVGKHKILTAGQASPAVLAMSIGGGGGAALYENAPTSSGAYTGNASGSSDGGNVSITLLNSTVSTTGAGSDAVVAVSTGNGGGLVISNTGTTSVATDTGSGGVVSIAITDQSVVSTAGGATPVVIFGGTGQSKNPNTILTDAGSSISNNQYLVDPNTYKDTTNAAENKWAIYAPDGYTNVTNYGSIVGNILLGTEGTGELFNYGSLSATGMLVADNSLHNFGVLLPSGPGSTQGMTIDGSLKTYVGSEIHIDVNPVGTGPANDLVTVTALARIAGEFVPQTQSLLPGGYSFLKAETLVFSGTIRDSHVFDWDVAVKDSGLTMSATAHFKPEGYGLEDNQGSLAGYLQRSWDGDSVGQALAFGYLHEYDRGDHAGFQAALDQMSGQVLNSQAIQMKTVFTTGLSDSLSCPAVTTAGYKLNQTNCTWIQLAGSIAEQSSTSSNLGYHVTTGGVRLGAQKQINADWRTGFALGYANNYLTATGLTSNGEFFNASASINKKFERWSFGGSLGLAHGWFKNYRTPQLGGNDAAGSMKEQYTSDSTMTMVALRLRAAYEYDRGDHYIKPYVDFDAIYSRQPGYTEQGAGVLALKANSNSQYNIGITPMIEYGTDVVTDGKRRIKAFVSAGVSFLPNNKVSTQMAFVNGLSGAGTYDVTTDGPTILGRFNVGIQAYESDSLEVRAQYGLQAGEGYWSQSVSANLLYRF